MVRTYQRKSTYSKYNKEHILQAVKAIKVDSKSLTKVADEYGIKVSSLYYHLNRYKYYDFTKEKEIKALKNFNQVFTKELEYEFVEQFIDATDYCTGLGPLNIRKFAYEFAMQNELDLRQTWVENETAGEDWLNAFLKRHPTITNIASYNTHSIQTFYKNYDELLKRFKFQDSKIFKVDEIAFITTADQPNRVFARRGRKESLELDFTGTDELITMVSTISANGSALVPMFKIPRSSFTSDMIEKALEGSLRVSNKSGWLSKSDFLEYLAHFVKTAKCSKTDPCLIILDNHASSLSLEAITYAKENGVYMLILPLHTYNQLQPLKERVFNNLRTKVNIACAKWDSACLKPLKVKDILKIVEKLFPQVFKNSDIKKGFELSNLYPLKYAIAVGDDQYTYDVNQYNNTNSIEDQKVIISTEFVNIQSAKDVQSSTKMPLSEIELILGISSPIEKEIDQKDIIKIEQEKTINDHEIEKKAINDYEIGESEQKINIKKKRNQRATKTGNLKKLIKRHKVEKLEKSAAVRTKRRRPKLNSKLSDYICY
ncbi:uncharacterized protein LOC131667914 [Phymastichus coffea]|uniref:uncharacterized protein LOC131667914 n=1 Tax=Phymastichus coffea TaxID=108790 RepID=UPI00273AE4B4|nr:uncharacterized protein LOC131667914 [Phymastichus coffea]XP_058797661.1 uncharacterized protein LOC131667914 [Phymastichus coffea]